MSSQSLADLFCAACAATGPLELEAEDAAGTRVGRWSLRRPFAVIGSDPRADVSLTNDRVSRCHVYLQVLAGGVFWIDLESRSGVHQDGTAEPSGWLFRDDTIGVGPYLVRLTGGVRPLSGEEPPRPNPLATRSLNGEVLSRLALELRGKSEATPAPRRVEMRRVLMLMGRTADCRLRFDADLVSRFHGAIVRTPAETWVVDLLSRDGLRLNGARVRWSRLDDGDKLTVGPFHMVVRHGPPPSPSPYVGLPALLPPAEVLVPVPVLGRPLTLPDLGMGEGRMDPMIWQFGQLQQQMYDQFQLMIHAVLNVVGSAHRDQMRHIEEELERLREITRELSELETRSAGPPDNADVPNAADQASLSVESPLNSADIPRVSDTVLEPDMHVILSRRITTLRSEHQGRWQHIVDLLRGIAAGGKNL